MASDLMRLVVPSSVGTGASARFRLPFGSSAAAQARELRSTTAPTYAGHGTAVSAAFPAAAAAVAVAPAGPAIGAPALGAKATSNNPAGSPPRGAPV